ncbi:hypothetical protein KC338_g299 [Hortaea werneckii]|nr:hypothetical protein KC338_g299 [Hortaea werneckii]
MEDGEPLQALFIASRNRALLLITHQPQFVVFRRAESKAAEPLTVTRPKTESETARQMIPNVRCNAISIVLAEIDEVASAGLLGLSFLFFFRTLGRMGAMARICLTCSSTGRVWSTSASMIQSSFSSSPAGTSLKSFGFHASSPLSAASRRCSSSTLDFSDGLAVLASKNSSFLPVARSLILQWHYVADDLLSLASLQEPHNRYTFHETPYAIAQEFASRLEGTVDPDVVIWSHEEVGALGRVIKCLAQDRVQGLLHTRRLDVPAAQVELGDGDEALNGVVNHTSRLEDEGGKGHAAEVGSRAELRDDVGSLSTRASSVEDRAEAELVLRCEWPRTMMGSDPSDAAPEASLESRQRRRGSIRAVGELPGGEGTVWIRHAQTSSSPPAPAAPLASSARISSHHLATTCVEHRITEVIAWRSSGMQTGHTPLLRYTKELKNIDSNWAPKLSQYARRSSRCVTHKTNPLNAFFLLLLSPSLPLLRSLQRKPPRQITQRITNLMRVKRLGASIESFRRLATELRNASRVWW